MLRGAVICVCLLAAGFATAAATQVKPWAVCYSDEISAAQLEPYDLLILDAQHHPALSPLNAKGKLLIGYVNAGEVEERDGYFKDVKAENLLLYENAEWKQSHLIDLRKTSWTSRMVNQIIPNILKQGFKGVFLDTLDNAIELEDKDPQKYAGMRKAAIALVKAIRAKFPGMPLIVNRALDILPEVGGDITMVLAESIYTQNEGDKAIFKLNDMFSYQKELAALQKLKKQFPDLRILSLEYWDPTDTKFIKEIYFRMRNAGFEPYVSTPSLDKIYLEPK